MFAVTDRRKTYRIPLFFILIGFGIILIALLARVGLADESADFTTSTIEASSFKAMPDGKLTFTIVVVNSGGDATDVTVTNVLPSNLEYIVGSLDSPMTAGVFEDERSAADNVISWRGSIKSGQQVTLKYKVNVVGEPPIDSAIANMVTIDSADQAVDISATIKVVESVNTTMFMPLLVRPSVPFVLSATRPKAAGSAYEWTLSWSADSHADGTRFVIEESSDPDFETDVKTYHTQATSRKIRHPVSTENVFYYRVSPTDDSFGTVSNVVEVVSAYRDDFSAETGWKIRREDSDDTDNELLYREDDGHLMMWVHGRWDYFIASPLKPAPEPPYRITTRVKFAGPGNLNTYGIVFGADWNGDRCVNDASSNCMNEYYRAINLWYTGENKMKLSIKRIKGHNDENAGIGAATLQDWRDVRLPKSANDWHEWSVEVYPGGRIEYFNRGQHLTTVHDATLVDQPYWGFWASTDEYPGSDPLYDWVLVEPIEQ